MKKVLLLTILVVLAYQGVAHWPQGTTPASDSSAARPASEAESPRASEPRSASASEPRAGAQFESDGTVVRVLSDDNEGSRHQRFIVRLASGRTVLIAHNIDLAPRVERLSEGDTVSFSGEFEENEQGGVVHWTHHDPAARHVGGWIRHRDRTYQ
jgi:hypothetical protein